MLLMKFLAMGVQGRLMGPSGMIDRSLSDSYLRPFDMCRLESWVSRVALSGMMHLFYRVEE